MKSSVTGTSSHLAGHGNFNRHLLFFYLGLIGHLKTLPAMNRLFLILLERSKLDPKLFNIEPTQEEFEIATGVRPFGEKEEAAYLKKLGKLQHAGNSIADAFGQQRARQAVRSLGFGAGLHTEHILMYFQGLGPRKI